MLPSLSSASCLALVSPELCVCSICSAERLASSGDFALPQNSSSSGVILPPSGLDSNGLSSLTSLHLRRALMPLRSFIIPVAVPGVGLISVPASVPASASALRTGGQQSNGTAFSTTTSTQSETCQSTLTSLLARTHLKENSATPVPGATGQTLQTSTKKKRKREGDIVRQSHPKTGERKRKLSVARQMRKTKRPFDPETGQFVPRTLENLEKHQEMISSPTFVRTKTAAQRYRRKKLLNALERVANTSDQAVPSKSLRDSLGVALQPCELYTCMM